MGWDEFIDPLWFRPPRSNLGDVLVLNQPTVFMNLESLDLVMQQPFGTHSMFAPLEK
jgi:hypothetical protein